MDTDTHSAEIIVSPAALPQDVSPVRPRGHLPARAAMIAGGILITAFTLALIGFALYPLFTGQGVREFFVSAIVPILISLMGIVPGLLLYFTGRHTLRCGPSYGAAMIACVLALPWLAAGFYLLPRIGVEGAAWRALSAGLGSILLAWSLSLAFGRYSKPLTAIT